jgi:FkbM family methyltransferase
VSGTDLLQKTPFAAAMADLPLCCLDVGSRGGMEPDLLPAAFAIDAVGFEPDQAECDRLNREADGPWRSARFLPTALAGGSGSRTLYRALDPVSSSLLPPVPATGKRFNQESYCTIVDQSPLETLGLDEAIDGFGLSAPDYLKLDTEGSELEILRGGERALATVSVIKTEVGFMTFRDGQPPARALDDFLSERGFELVALISPAHWRRHGHVLHPRVSRESIPYSRGQLAQSDFLYMRHPDGFALEGADRDTIAARRLKAAWLAMIYGYFDRAEEYLADSDATRLLRERWRLEAGEALRLASQISGRAAWRRALVQHMRGLVPLLRNGPTALSRRP